jgi:hypothetical protein
MLDPHVQLSGDNALVVVWGFLPIITYAAAVERLLQDEIDVTVSKADIEFFFQLLFYLELGICSLWRSRTSLLVNLPELRSQ